MPELGVIISSRWTIYALLLTVFAVGALVWAEVVWQAGESRQLVWKTKPLASGGFLLAAIFAGALGSTLGQLIFVGLLLGALGDILLIPEGQKTSFKLGMVAFLGGHIVYVYAFFTYGIFTDWSWVTASAMVFVGSICLRVFWPHVQGVLRPLLVAYIFVIALMVVSATGMTVAFDSAIYLTAAGLFMVSDILVACDRFIRHQPMNAALSLPMYYLAQLLFALAAGASVGL